MSTPQPEVKPAVRVNVPVAAGYVVWVTLIGWFTSPFSPSWPETLFAAPLAMTAAVLVGQGKKS